MSAAEVERAAHAATVALSEFDRAGVMTVLQTVPALALTLRELLAAVTAPSPPADDVREALDHLDALNESGRIQYADYVALHDMVSRIEVRPYGTVAPTPDEWAAQMDAERVRQIEHGYDDAHDAEHGVDHLLNWAIDYARRGNNLAAATMARCALRLPRGTVTDAEALRLGKVAWVAFQEDKVWAQSVVEDCFSPADDLPQEALDMIAVARAVLEAAREARS